MKVSHSPAMLFAAFDDPDLIAHAGLVPTIRLAERCGLPALVAAKVKLTGAKIGAGTAAEAKTMSIVGGMAAGADSIDDLDVLRHGGRPGCSAEYVPRRRWARSCARSPGGTCANWSPQNLTLHQLIARLGGGRGHRVFAGTPEQITDQIEEWFTQGAADGFDIMPPYFPGGLDDFVDQVVPILQHCGLFRTEYTGRTLRDHYGLPRPANRLAAA